MKHFSFTIRKYGDFLSVVGHNRLVIIVYKLALIELMTTVQDGIGDLGSIAKLRGKATDFRPNHNNLRRKVSLEESSRLVSNTENLDIIEALAGGNLGLQLSSDVLVDVAELLQLNLCRR